ncbi:MAG: DNA polymerase III subunit gamma/tau [Solirubrobacteraceae bacterium MAG38_C4-C5]|nr:DNA polymerase III subunit gamma/tau [Candidatus Siliceabacter maunaloa]
MSEAASLYRRHRPRTFAQVVGQEHVVRTLRNAVDQGKVHHAYLFVGSRGTGKTSMAKILAACLNCEHGPTTEPDGTCPSCTAIATATSLDVIEMDAASNNSVDDIRDLRERVAFAPVSGRSKVYILDEAHMLSPQAWNAFLKTLEEPPPDTVFVLATTEAAKVLPTVVDRCHRFDFTRPTVDQIASVLRRVAQEEQIAIDPEAIALLARHATGSFRDALGTLEQLVTYTGSTISTDDVLAVLGVADADLLFGALDAVAARDARAALHAAAALIRSGRDAGAFLRDLEAHARDLMIVQTLGEVPLELALTPERDRRLAEQAGRLARGDTVRVLDLLARAWHAVADGADARTRLELALVEAAAPQLDPATRALAARVEHLEGRLGGTVTAPPPDPPSSPVAAAIAPPPADASPLRSVPDVNGDAPAPAGVPEPAAHPGPPSAGSAPPPVESPSEQPRPPQRADGAALDLPALREAWPAVLDTLRDEKAFVASCLENAVPITLADGVLTAAFPADDAFIRRKCEEEPARSAVSQAIREVTGARLRVTYELREADELAGAGWAGTDSEAPDEDAVVERLKAELDATEIVPDADPDPQPDPEERT